MADWESNKFKVHAVMTVPELGPDGTDIVFTFDVIMYDDNFELNSIPGCTLSLALGRRADRVNDPDYVAAIHKAINVLKIQVPVVVYCKALQMDSSGFPHSQWPVAEDGSPTTFVIFRGLAVSGGFRKVFGDASYTLMLTHWLTNMNYSSALSQQSHPSTPNAFFFPASFNLKDPFGGGFLPVGSPGWVGPATAAKFFTPDQVITDFWGGVNPGAKANGGMKVWLTTLSGQDRLNPTQINIGLAAQGEVGCNFEASKNTDALAALARFEPNDHGDGVPTYKLGVPLPMDIHGANSAVISNLIGQEVGLETLESYSNVTLWDKLAGQFHANYLFSIVPTVETALVVPFIPGLRGPVHRTIGADEYDGCEIRGDLPRPLRGIGVMMGRTWSAGTRLDPGERSPQYPGIGGWFGVCSPGLVMFKHAPRWLTHTNPSFYTSNNLLNIIGNVLNPGEGQPRLGKDIRGLFRDAQSIWNAYAQALYVYEILKYRMGTLSGRVRFDIAPGSLVKIQAAEDKFVWNLIGQKDYMYHYATVLRTSTHIDAEAQQAGTSFTLAHVRTEAENVDAHTSICRHPLWTNVWAGCSLIDDPAFAPVTTRVTNQLLVGLLCGQVLGVPLLF